MKRKISAILCSVLMAVSMSGYVYAEGLDNVTISESDEVGDEISSESGAGFEQETDALGNVSEQDTDEVGNVSVETTEDDIVDSEVYEIEEFSDSASIVFAAVSESPSIDEVSLSLTGNICVNMVCTIPDSIRSQSGAYVLVNGTKTLLTNLEASSGRYIVKATVAPKDYDSLITVAFYTSNGTVISMLNTAGKQIDRYEMSIPKYIEAVMNSSFSNETKTVAETLKNYCNCAKTYFLNNGAVTPSQSVQTAMNNVTGSSLAKYRMAAGTSSNEFEYLGQSLILEDSTVLRFYFRIPADRKISDYTIKIDGTTMSPVATSGVYYVNSTPLLATELKNTKQLDIYRGSSKIAAYTVYGAASYICDAFDYGVDDKLQNTLKALYVYGEAAEKAKEKSAVVEEKLPSGNSIVYTEINYSVTAVGQYINWDGVSNVAEFTDGDGNYCFAYDGSTNVTIVKCLAGKVVGTISLRKQHSIFGNVICDADGNYYVVTGENGSTDRDAETVFISKYDENGNHIKTVGNNGSSSLAFYYGDDFYTCKPFDAGTCDVAVNGKILAVDYAREMYSGHQSNSVWLINIDTMATLPIGGTYDVIYDSHSFAQRAVPYGSGFVFISQGDCYPRSFDIQYYTGSQSYEKEIFHFWTKKGTFDAFDMWELNRTYATMGDLAVLANDKVAFVASSAPDLSENAVNQARQIFIQIFDPNLDLSKASSYVTVGTRSGMGGENGDIYVTDYGVQWLTNDTSKTYKNPQAVSDGNDTIVVLYEQYSGSSYEGVYYMVLDGSGIVKTNATLYSATAKLNSCQTPIWIDGKIYWTANQYGMLDKLYNYILVP